MILFWCKCGFGKCSGTSLKPNHWCCCDLSCKILLSVTCYSPIKKWFIVVTYNKRRQHFKKRFFWFFDQLMRHALIKLFSPFQFAASVWTSIECLTLKSLATSSVVVRESVWIFPSFGCCQLPIVDPTPLIIFFLIFSFTWILFHFLKIYFHWRVITLQYRGGFCHASTWISHGCTLHSLSLRLLSPLQNFLSHHWTVRSLAVPGPNALLMLQVVSTALWPILN